MHVDIHFPSFPPKIMKLLLFGFHLMSLHLSSPSGQHLPSLMFTLSCNNVGVKISTLTSEALRVPPLKISQNYITTKIFSYSFIPYSFFRKFYWRIFTSTPITSFSLIFPNSFYFVFLTFHVSIIYVFQYFQ